MSDNAAAGHGGRQPWMTSLHGGHSSDYCDHAQSTLREMIGAAISFGYHSFGISEHAPRGEERFLYPNEIELGWTLEKTLQDFERYCIDLPEIAAEFDAQITVIRGFEAEVVPTDGYVQRMKSYRSRTLPSGEPLFDFMVGSVHYVNEIQIDGEPEEWIRAAEFAGGAENLAVAYYETITQMVNALRPDVVGHLDLIKRNVVLANCDPALLLTERVKAAALECLQEIKVQQGILDLNTAGWRKGLGEPYPAPWIIEIANSLGVPFCFGDDSHNTGHVGAGVIEAREYLLANGVNSITGVGRGGLREIYQL
jgi:histidinol-phosphatase (PHP family)